MEYLVSIITFVLGFIISEIIRRLNRTEALNIQIFEKRLNVYIELYEIWEEAYSNMCTYVHTLKDEKIFLDSDEFFEKTFYIVEPLLMYMDKMSLILSDELKVHCGAVFLGYDDNISDGYDAYLKELAEQNLKVKNMIKSEIGIDKLNKNMKKIMKYNHDSAVISYYHNLKKNMK